MNAGLYRGKLTKWKDDRGFGFIQPVDDSPEVFLHISALKDSSRRPIVGDTIYYHIARKDGKVYASYAFILGARLKQDSQSSLSNQKTTAQTQNSYPSLVLKVVALSILPAMGMAQFSLKTGNPLVFIMYILMSLVSFSMYANDKSCAKQGKWRTPEQSLLLCDFFGGWLGGFFAQQKLRHKVSKQSYQVRFWLIVVMHYAFWLFWLIASNHSSS
jgi:uncharacterized membrane protein YsdA (DUF1294 family)/cold shock CspA family protein